MQAIEDIISYFFPYYFNCHAKKCTKIQLGKIYDIFSPRVLIFFPLRPCNHFSTLTDCVLGEKYCKREIKSYLSRWTQFFFVSISELSISNGGKYMIFFPPDFIFPPVSLFFPPVSSFFPSLAMQLIVLVPWHSLYKHSLYVTKFIWTFFIRDRIYTGQNLYGTKFIQDKVYTGTKFIRDKVHTVTKFIRGQSLYKLFHTVFLN